MKRLAVLLACTAAFAAPAHADNPPVNPPNSGANLWLHFNSPAGQIDVNLNQFPLIADYRPQLDFLTTKLLGLPTSNGEGYLKFVNSYVGGGVSLYDAATGGLVFALNGPQLYKGTELSPELLTGDYALFDPITNNHNYSAHIESLATDTPAVPEPASWALMIGGFGLAGAAMRVRSRKLAFANAA